MSCDRIHKDQYAQVHSASTGIMAENDFLYQFRLILIGKSTVGKSSILRQFKEGEYYPDISLTVGVDFHAKLVKVNGHSIKLQLWDTAGQDRFRAIVKAYYRNAVGGLLVYDITNRTSFLELNAWLQDAIQHAEIHKPVFILVGNKSDQGKSREVSTEDAQRYADEHGMQFIETSAKTGRNVEEVFQHLASIIYHKVEDGEIKLRDGWEGVKKGEQRPRSSSKRNSTDNGTVSVYDRNSTYASQQERPKKGCCGN